MKYFTQTCLVIVAVFFISCTEDDDPIVSSTYEATFSINPNNFPAGGGLSFTASDTGRVVQLDVEPDFDWDILMITYKTSSGGRPGILLRGDESTSEKVVAADVSSIDPGIGYGKAGFEALTTVDQELISELSADGVFDFDPETDVDELGKPDEAALAAAYENLVIGNRIVNLDEAEQPVYLVQLTSGEYFKFQLANREGGGNATVRWGLLSR